MYPALQPHRGNLPGKLTLGAQLGAHELGYDDNLWYIGFGIPFAERWQVESNNYFATTGIDRDDEWRSVLNLIYNAPAGWEVLVGGGYGQVDSVNALSKEDVNVIHGVVSMPIFGFHRLHAFGQFLALLAQAKVGTDFELRVDEPWPSFRQLLDEASHSDDNS